MRSILVLLVISFVAFADDMGCTESFSGIAPAPGGTDAITLTVVDTWTVSWASQALGMDVFENGSSVYVLHSSRNDVQIASFDPSTGTPGGTMNLDPGNTNCFGVAWNNDPDTDTYYTDDWTDTVLYYTENFGTSWTTSPNPASNQGRGMDFDGTDYWISNSSTGVYRFQPGVGQEAITLPEVPTQISGLTVFPYEGDLGLCVTTYNTYNWYFYSWDGSSATYLGSAACPAAGTPLGLAYCTYRDTIFWSYSSGGTYYIAEVEFDIDIALERATWAEIKTSF